MNDKLLTDADAALHDVIVEQRHKGLTHIHADLQKDAEKLAMFDELVETLDSEHKDANALDGVDCSGASTCNVAALLARARALQK